LARTPLLSKLQALYRDFEEAERSHLSVKQVQRERTFTRREVLKAGGALAAGAALGPQLPAFAGASQFTGSIAVVGGGIAGLNAALTLVDAGISPTQITIYEASNRVGGRMHSDSPLFGSNTWADGQVSEHCGELIDTGHKTIQGLARRFGFGLTDLLAAQPNRSTDTLYFHNTYYSDDQANSDFMPVYNQVHADASAAGFPTLYNMSTQRGRDLDRMSLYDYIETYVPGGHNSNMGRLLDVAYNTEYGGDSKYQSSLNLIYLLAYQPQPGDFRIFGLSDERYHITGGNEQVPRAIAAYLMKQGVALNLNTPLTSITNVGTNGPFQLTFNLPSGTPQPKPFTRVILALPFSVLRTILTSGTAYRAAGFDSLKQTAITYLGYGTNSKLHLQFDSRLWNTSNPAAWGISTGYTFSDLNYQNTWDVSRGQQGSSGILVNYTGGTIGAAFTGNPTSRGVVDRYANAFLAQIEHVFPGISALWNGRATLDFPTGNPYLLGSYSFWKVGQYTSFSGYELARMPNPAPTPLLNPKTGKCHFAGEHCSINFQGYMEGGATEGARAANEILSDLKAGIAT